MYGRTNNLPSRSQHIGQMVVYHSRKYLILYWIIYLTITWMAGRKECHTMNGWYGLWLKSMSYCIEWTLDGCMAYGKGHGFNYDLTGVSLSIHKWMRPHIHTSLGRNSCFFRRLFLSANNLFSRFFYATVQFVYPNIVIIYFRFCFSLWKKKRFRATTLQAVKIVANDVTLLILNSFDCEFFVCFFSFFLSCSLAHFQPSNENGLWVKKLN